MDMRVADGVDLADVHRADIREAEDFLARNPAVKHIELYIVDANGVPRGKWLHRDELLEVYRHGRPLPSTMFGLTLLGEDVETSGLVWDVGDADCHAFPIPGGLTTQLHCAQTSDVANVAAMQVMLDRTEGALAIHADPRWRLIDAIDRLTKMGYHAVMAAELEFYLVAPRADATVPLQLARHNGGPAPHGAQVYGLHELSQIAPFLGSLYSECEAQGIPARAAISENAPGQYEIALLHGPALVAIDQGIRYKRAVKNVARRHGMQATFMAKPFAGMAGSGLHMHVSLEDADGNNLFAADDPSGSPLLRHALAGMLAHTADAFALFCPNANSYGRFADKSYVPMRASWGVNNRTVSFRIPAGPPHGRHIEHRVSGADANPYLVAAAILSAIASGIDAKGDPGPAVEGNGYAVANGALNDSGVAWPVDWLSALDRWRTSPWAANMFGTPFLKLFNEIKLAEYRNYQSEVAEKDWRWYLTHT